MMSLWQTWRATAAKHPRKIVVTEAETGHTWTCAQLLAAAEARASTITDSIFALPNSAAWFIEFLACQKAGLPAVPLDPTLPADIHARLRLQLSRRYIALPHIVCIKLTSGTTGGSHPVLCTARNLLSDGRQICATMGIRASDCNLALIPLGH